MWRALRWLPLWISSGVKSNGGDQVARRMHNLLIGVLLNIPTVLGSISLVVGRRFVLWPITVLYTLTRRVSVFAWLEIIADGDIAYRDNGRVISRWFHCRWKWALYYSLFGKRDEWIMKSVQKSVGNFVCSQGTSVPSESFLKFDSNNL